MDLSGKNVYIVSEYDAYGSKNYLGIFEGNIIDIAFTLSKDNPLEFTKIRVTKIGAREIPSRLSSVIRVNNMDEFSATHLFAKEDDDGKNFAKKDIIHKFTPGPDDCDTNDVISKTFEQAIADSSLAGYVKCGKSIHFINDKSFIYNEAYLQKIPFIKLDVDKNMPAVEKMLSRIDDCTKEELEFIKSLD